MIELTSNKVMLNNLGTQLSGELRVDFMKLGVLNAPVSAYLDNNYFTYSGTKEVIEEFAENDNNGRPRSDKKFSLKDLSIIKMFRELNKEDEGNTESLSLKMGEAPVINPPWQFNELDDVRSNLSYPRMGRIYLENIYSNFPIVVFQPGREKYNTNFLSFFTKGLGSDAKNINNYIREGGDPSLLNSIRLGLTNIKNATLSIIDGALGLIGLNSANLSKYIVFKPAMKLYRQIINGLFREVAANMGLLNLTAEPYNLPVKNGKMGYDETEDGYSTAEGNGGEGSVLGKNKDKIADVGSFLGDLGDAFSSSYRGSVNHLDILQMIPGSNYRDKNGGILMYMGDMLNKCYLPFLCQNTISVSETFSNGTKTHPIMDQINSLSQEASDDRAFGGAKQLLDSVTGASGGNIVEKVTSMGQIAVDKVVKTVTGEVASNAGEMGLIMTGGGRMLVPEIWASSSYSRNYSIDFKFYSPVGDTVSVMENVYIPFLILFALTAPIQSGHSAYTSPFIVKVFSKGLFSIDLGIIESLTVTRGEDKNDRTRWGYPRTLKVSISIKDLAPTMMMSIGGGAFWKYRKANTGLSEYIATLSGLSISDRMDLARNFKVYWSQLVGSLGTKFSLESIGFSFSQSIFMKPFSNWASKRLISIDSLRTKNIY